MKFISKMVSYFIIILLITLSGCTNVDKSDSPGNVVEQERSNEKADENEEGNNIALSYKQSPMLDSRNLPPIEERLPHEPKLTNEMPPELLDYEIGQFGGTLRTVTDTNDSDLEIFVMANEPLLNTPGILGEEITGNVLKGYDVTPDQLEFTFYMREGLKWSDGEPVTVEDVRFTIEDVLFNEDLTPLFPSLFRSGGKAEGDPMDFEILDDFSFKLTFSEPYGGLPIRLAITGWVAYTELLKPAHYLKQFHQDYTDEQELKSILEENGFREDDWVNFFHYKDIVNWELTSSGAIGFPVLYPWMITEASNTVYHFERNPYYFKVDSAGNQLPYIDKLESTLVQDVETVSMKVISGEVDFLRIATALNKMPLYKEYEEASGYKTILSEMHITPTDVFLNLTYDDSNWREVVRDIRFRKALNLALNREEIIDAIYFGFAEPSKMIDPTFDVDEANRLLDEMGMEKGSDGFRLGPDGNKFTLPIDISAQAPDIVPLTELIVEMWKEIGIDTSMKVIDSSLWSNRVEANEIQATMIWTHTPLWYMADWGQNFWGPLWNRWYNTGGQQGEEPPKEVKHFYDLINKVQISSPEDARNAIEEVKSEMREHLWYFVHIENVKQPLIIHEKLGNVSEKGMAISTHFAGEQFYFKD